MIKKTVLYEKLLGEGGKFVEFGGFYMPVQFRGGILSEHRAVRETAGIFDVSHMGEFILEGAEAERDVGNLFTNEFADMPKNKVRYTLMCNEDGGVADDLLVYKADDRKYYIVVNASNTDKDRELIKSRLKYGSVLRDVSDEISMIAVQGPRAEALLGGLFSELPKGFYTFVFSEFSGERAVISRTGYTGEDGFEIYAPNSVAIGLLERILEVSGKYGAVLAGLGARDTLRLESAMPLYGHEMNEGTLATEIGLNAYIKLGKREFVGRDALVSSPPGFRRVGLKITDRGVAREGYPVYRDGKNIGYVTSGTMSPTLGYPVAMARLSIGAELGGGLTVEARGRTLAAEIVGMPFYKR
ncbi:MAG: glycine cleavage system aminomethyltransferase GcvT [Clostridiales bacterium]|jgi:aminomethyltransferase|nr:glycine cleavage system aminomethyltransferase GcvT [Clostridiales bacterium]